MRIRHLLLGAALALAGVGVASADTMPPTMKLPSTSSPGQPLDHGKKHKKRQDYGWNAQVDCHRDVRTHRINGIKIRHRHVGDDCRIREVRQMN
jgi:hypothetical protein